MKQGFSAGYTRYQSLVAGIFGLGRTAALIAALLVGIVLVLAVYWFIQLAPPQTITLAGGPQGSIFQAHAERYAKILARNGVKLKILPSQGFFENIRKLTGPASRVDIGFVQGGVSGGLPLENVASLGSLYNEPLLVFYRSPGPWYCSPN